MYMHLIMFKDFLTQYLIIVLIKEKQYKKYNFIYKQNRF